MTLTATGDPYRERVEAALGPAYELRALLGSGGFAEVYAAWDAGLKREVAVKVLRQDLAPEATLVARFRREAETVAGLRHPNIVPIYQVGEGEGIVFFIMPLVRGVSLGEWLECDRRPPFREIRRILMEIGGALSAAHGAGLVHRDIKPDNIMLEGDERRVLVMDFGIAKPLSVQDVSLTATGMIIGTPQYMSPEQGSGDTVDHRSDIYSLGVVGYQLITGQLPFTGGSVIALLMQHATADPPSMLEARPDCPTDLERAIRRCLAKAPEQRWQSASELRDALAAERTSLAVDRPPDEVPETPGATDAVGRFRRTIVAALVTVSVAFAVDMAVIAGLQFAPLVLFVSLFAGAAAYGRLRVAGHDWRDAIPRGGAIGSPGSVTPATGAGAASSDEVEFGPYAGRVRQARRDRAALVGLLAQLPNSEREVLHDVLPLVDGLLVQSADNARTLTSIERAVRGGIDADRRAEADARRAEISGEMESAVEAIGRIRAALRRVGHDGLTVAAPAVREAVDIVKQRPAG